MIGKIGLVMALAFGLGGCNGTNVPSARQGVYAALSAYDGALKGAIAYAGQLPCGPAAPPAPLCSDPVVVGQMQGAVRKAAPIIQQLLATSQSPTATDGQLAVAVASAISATQALQLILVTVKGTN